MCSQISENKTEEIPNFSKNYLVDLAGWDLFKQGKSLAEGRTITHVEWTESKLLGKVDNGRMIFHPKLIFGKSSIPDIECNCRKGRVGEICPHVVGISWKFQQEREGKSPDKSGVKKSIQEPEKPEPLIVKTLQISPVEGKELQLIVLLPPNLPITAPKDSIVVKLETEVDGKKTELSQLNQSITYKTTPHTYSAIATVEKWCGGKLSAILQLDRKKLLQLLTFLQGTTSVRSVQKPKDPLLWSKDRISGVHEYLGQVEEPYIDENKTNTPAIEEKDDKAGLEKEDLPIVDGSSQFIRIKLQSREYLYYRELLALVKSNGFHLESGNLSWWLRGKHSVLNFLAENLNQLESYYRCLFTDNFKSKRKDWHFPEIKVETNSHSDGTYEVEVKLDTGRIPSLAVSDCITRGSSYVEDQDKVYLISSETLSKMENAQKAILGESNELFQTSMRKKVSTRNLGDVEDIIEKLLPNWVAPDDWKLRSAALRDLTHLAEIPELGDLRNTLRPYQVLGASWLYYLFQNKLGGILADEMGLGKTLQALTFIRSIYREQTSSKPFLIVCPASLTENWRREVKKFCPEIPVYVHHRNQKIDADGNWVGERALIITSYGTLNRDDGMLRDTEWIVVIGDEAQHIKNKRTQNFESMSGLLNEGRFLLTGTPIENSVDDLRSLFTFLMPGYLAKIPTKIDREERAWYDQRHAEQAAHYILRRTKKEVAPELPEKIEKTIFCDLTDAQEKVYKSVLDGARKEIFDMEMSGATEGRIRMAGFTHLLRMRQICADPRIIDNKLKASDSCKWEALQDVLDDALNSESKILLFSQFVKALSWVRTELEHRKIPYCYLDGSTNNRLAEVDRFNNSPHIPIFLISTKAGGTGLNLTSADTVIHYDPWWNPAVEAQATDRAHRIGQTRTVTSIKLIASGTVEEKVMQMQQEKAQLLEDLWEANEQANASLDLKDFKSLFE